MRNKIDCPFPQVPNRPLNSHKHDKPSCITCINLDESAWNIPIFGLKKKKIPQEPRAKCIISWDNLYNDFIKGNHMNLIFLYDFKNGLGPPNVDWVLSIIFSYNDEWNDS